MADFGAKNFRLTDSGLGKVLGSLERQVMDVVWEREGASGKEVFEEIRKTRGIALTTVLTVLERLTKKGLVEKVKGESVFIFRPVFGREEFAEKVSCEVLKGVAEISSSALIASFVDILAEKDPGELESLSRIVQEKLSELEKRN